MTSIRDVAEAANVSTSTLSLALRGSPKVAFATRARLQALAKRMGYSSPEDHGPKADPMPWLQRRALENSRASRLAALATFVGVPEGYWGAVA